MQDKLLGVGLTNLLGIWLMCTLLSLVAKVVFTKYEVTGISEIFQAA